MGHHHHHGHDHHHHHDSSLSNLSVAFFLNLGFTIIEIIGGIMTNSVAILSDALHDLGDSLSLGLAWYFQKISGKKRDATFPYGYKRFSLLGALINSIILVVGAIVILTKAIPRLFDPVAPDAKGMMIIAVFGIIVNGAAVFRLKSGTSLNERVVSLHLMEDVLGWVAVLIGSIVMYFFDWPIIDPILSIGISIFILINVYKSLKESLKIILQAVPENMDMDLLKTTLQSFQEIEDIHDTRLWSLDGTNHVLTIHVVLAKDLSLEKLYLLKHKIRKELHDLKIEHVTIEFERKGEECGWEKGE